MDPEGLLGRIQSSSEESETTKALSDFVQANQTNFTVGGDTETRERLCQCLVQQCKTDQSDSHAWSHDTLANVLTTLRILSREKSGCGPLCCEEGLHAVAVLAKLTDGGWGRLAETEGVAEPEMRVMVEAVKCLCNVILKNQHLATLCARVGMLEGLAHHLSLLPSLPPPHDLLYFDLRLLFLITACSPEQRTHFREDHNGLQLMLRTMDTVLFGPSSSSSAASLEQRGEKTRETETLSPVSEQPSSPPSVEVDLTPASGVIHGLPMREGVVTLPHPLDEGAYSMLCEVLKIVFNQTVDWNEGDLEEEELHLMMIMVHLLRVLLTSIPAQLSTSAMTMVGHCAEVLVNAPLKTAHCLLLPSSVRTTPTLQQWYPSLYPQEEPAAASSVDGGVVSGVGVVHQVDTDKEFDGFNMAAVVNLLNYLHVQLCEEKGRNLSPVITALRQVSRGHRSIRRYLKAEVLPPLQKVTHRPEEGGTLKSRLVRLMLPGLHGAEEVVAEFLFVLCKEDANRLIKHTGYGNAAGLLMAHGLLGGGRGEGAGLYSSDSEESDTEDYDQEEVDPVTGGRKRKDERSPLDDMTEEEKEREADKLYNLMKRLDEQGIIRMVPLGENQRPMFHDHHHSSSGEEGEEN